MKIDLKHYLSIYLSILPSFFVLERTRQAILSHAGLSSLNFPASFLSSFCPILLHLELKGLAQSGTCTLAF